MLKRGQVTIFLMVGILILFIFAGLFYIVSVLEQKGLLAETEELPETLALKTRVSSFVESCLRETAIPGIYLLGIQGGVIYPADPTKVLITESSIINYGYLNGVDQLSVEAMEEELDLYIEENLDFCLDDFYPFTEQGLLITSKELNSESKINGEQVVLRLDYEVKIVKGEDELTLNSFSGTVPLQVGNVVEEAKSLVENREQVSSVQSAYFRTAFPFSRDTIIYSLSDENSVIDGAPFTFMFAVKDDGINSPPELEYIPNLVVRKGTNFVYQLRADDSENDILTYSVEPVLFTIGEKGWINETMLQAGTFMVRITVADIHGLSDEQEVRIIVE